MASPLPPDTRLPGQPDPAGDMDKVTDALVGMGEKRVLLPSGDVTGVADALAVTNLAASLGAGGGVIELAPGDHYWKCGNIVIARQGVTIHGGPGTIVHAVGTGDTIRMYYPLNYAPGVPVGGGLAGGFIIDGSSAGAGSCGFHIGDIYQLGMDVRVRNFQGAGSKGAWFDNNYYWTEQILGKLWIEQCTSHVVFDNSANLSGSATGSFDRAVLDIFLDCKNKGNGVILQNGAFILDGRLGIYGNTDQPATQCAVLTLTGSSPGGYSLIANSILNIGVELNNISSGIQPYTISFGTAGSNGIFGCTGVIDFSGNNPFAHTPNFAASFQFDGPVYGDPNLMRSWLTGSVPYQSGALASNGFVYTRYTAMTRVTTSSNVTGIILGAGSGSANQRQQTFIVINSGTGSITFDVPATSHVADGTSDVIAPNTAALFVWNNDSALWYRIY